MKIGIDIDGIINNIEKFQLENAIPYFREKFNKEVVNPDGFDIRDIFGLTEEEEYMRREFWKPFIFELARKAPVRYGMKELIEKIKENGDIPYIVTERYATDRDNLWGKLHRKFVKEYLKSNGIEIDQDKIIFCSEGTKVEAYKEHGLAVALEDSVKNIKSLNDNGIPVIAITANHNKNYENELLYRVDTPYEILDKIEKVSQIEKIEAEKKKIKRPGKFLPTTGYASKDEPWRKYYSDEEEASVTVPKKKMIDHLKDSNKDNLDLTIIRDEWGNKYTFREFFKEVEKYAKSFKALGVKEKDHVIIGLPNLPEEPFAQYALNLIGAIPVLINPLSSEKEMKHYLTEKSLSGEKPKMMIMFNRSYDALKNLYDDSEVEIKHYISIGVDTLMKQPLKTGYKIKEGKNDPKKELLDSNPKILTLEQFLEKGKEYEGPLESEYKEGEYAIIYYTGGSTGEEKATMGTNEGCNYIAEAFRTLIDNSGPGDITLNAMPMFHVFGGIQIFHFAACKGMDIALIAKFNRNDVEKYFKGFYPVKNCNGVPTFMNAIFSNLKGKQLKLVSPVVNTIYGGSSMTNEEKNSNDKVLKKSGSVARMTGAFGITEGMGGVIYPVVGADRENCIGIPIPGTSAKIVEPGTTKELKYGEVGEICFIGPSQMLAYLNNKLETEVTLRTHEDGKLWLHTGDLGKCDSNGRFYFVERLKRIIICSGENIYPNRIENTICGNVDEVESCFVVEKHDSMRQGVPHAKVKLKEGVIPTIELKNKIMEACRANFKNKRYHPVQIDFINKVPMTKKSSPDYVAIAEDKNLVIDIDEPKVIQSLNIVGDRYAGNKLYKVSRVACKTWYKFSKDITLVGKEYIPPAGPAIIGMNHLHKNDQLPLMINLDRIISLFAKQEYFEHPIIGPFYKKLEMIPVDRFGDAKYAKERIMEIINSIPLQDFEKEQPIIEKIIKEIKELPIKEYSKPQKMLDEALAISRGHSYKLSKNIIEKLEKMPTSGEETGYGHAFKSTREAESRLRKGRLFGIFPEGTRNTDFYKTGQFLTFSNSAGFLARDFQAPLIPTAITGDYKFRGKLMVRVGKPMFIDKDQTKDEVKEAMDEFKNALYNLVVQNLIEQPTEKNKQLLIKIASEFNDQLTDETLESLEAHKIGRNKVKTLNFS